MTGWLAKRREALLAARAPRSPSVWLVDMDNTLFNASAGMLAAIHERMQAFIAKRLGVSLEEAHDVQVRYWREYGATFAGLERRHGISAQEFWDATHRFPLAPHVIPSVSPVRLRQVLERLPGRRVLLTNGPHFYAQEVLRALRLSGVFHRVLAAGDLKIGGCVRCKPDPLVWRHAASLEHAAPAEAVLIDDSLSNLRGARALGVRTVWCSGCLASRPETAPAWLDAEIATLADLPAVVARLRRTPSRRP